MTRLNRWVVSIGAIVFSVICAFAVNISSPRDSSIGSAAYKVDNLPGETHPGVKGEESRRKPRTEMRNVPEFSTREPTIESVVTEPTDSRYDALAVLRTMKITEAGVFDREPRDESWAAKTESKIADLLRADFQKALPEVDSISVECRTSSCQLDIGLPSAKNIVLRNRAEYLAQLTSFGERTLLTETGDNRVVLNVVMSKGVKESQEYGELIETQRRRRIEMLANPPAALPGTGQFSWPELYATLKAQ